MEIKQIIGGLMIAGAFVYGITQIIKGAEPFRVDYWVTMLLVIVGIMLLD